MSDALRYIARELEDIEPDPVRFLIYWIGVFQVRDGVETQVGEYLRNYHLLSTFYHFRKGGQDFALYSRDYTATRVMLLPSCTDLGGEERDEDGFCPAEYYVPYEINTRIQSHPRHSAS
jgi:hypothetical protein